MSIFKDSKTKLAWFSRLLRRPGSEVGSFYNAPEPTVRKQNDGVVMRWYV